MRSPSAGPAGLCPGRRVWAGRARQVQDRLAISLSENPIAGRRGADGLVPPIWNSCTR